MGLAVFLGMVLATLAILVVVLWKGFTVMVRVSRFLWHTLVKS